MNAIECRWNSKAAAAVDRGRIFLCNIQRLSDATEIELDGTENSCQDRKQASLCEITRDTLRMTSITVNQLMYAKFIISWILETI